MTTTDGRKTPKTDEALGNSVTQKQKKGERRPVPCALTKFHWPPEVGRLELLVVRDFLQ